MIVHTAIDHVNTYVNHKVRTCEDISTRGYCTATWNPGTYGDCKQFASLKLAMLLRMGVRPQDLTLWIVRTPYAHNQHAVLVYNPTSEVLDAPGPVVCGSWGCTRSDDLVPRAVKEKQGFQFLHPCDACAGPARKLARDGKL